MHVVLRLLANPDEEVKARIALMVADSVRAAHKHDIHSVRSAEQVREFHVSMSSWGFMTELKGVVASLQNLSSMERLGMVVSFPPSLQNTPLSDPRVANDDMLSGMIWKLVKAVLKQRSLSSLWYVSSCPGMWGSFLSNDQTVRDAAMRRFRDHWETFCECEKSHLPALRSVAERHSCASRCAQDMARLCRAAGWTVDARVIARTKLIFEGICQENLLENGMKACREVEVKQGTSKQNRAFRYW